MKLNQSPIERVITIAEKEMRMKTLRSTVIEKAGEVTFFLLFPIGWMKFSYSMNLLRSDTKDSWLFIATNMVSLRKLLLKIRSKRKKHQS